MNQRYNIKNHKSEKQRSIFNKTMQKNPKSKQRNSFQRMKVIQNTQWTRPGKKLSIPHNNQNIKCTKWRQYIACYKGKSSRHIKIENTIISMLTLNTRKVWANVLQVLKDHTFQHRLLYPAKLAVIIEEERKFSMVKPQI